MSAVAPFGPVDVRCPTEAPEATLRTPSAPPAASCDVVATPGPDPAKLLEEFAKNPRPGFLKKAAYSAGCVLELSAMAFTPQLAPGLGVYFALKYAGNALGVEVPEHGLVLAAIVGAALSTLGLAVVGWKHADAKRLMATRETNATAVELLKPAIADAVAKLDGYWRGFATDAVIEKGGSYDTSTLVIRRADGEDRTLSRRDIAYLRAAIIGKLPSELASLLGEVRFAVEEPRRFRAI